MKSPVDDSYRLLAAQYLRKQVRQLTAQIEGIRQAQDIEYVHRARVATRRLRAALRMFDDCFGAKKFRTWSKAIRRVTDELSDARDKDVQIVFVRDALEKLPERACWPGVIRLLVELERQREAVQPAVVKALDQFQQSRVPDKMTTKTKRMAKGLEERGVTVASPYVLQRAAEKILARLDDLLALESSLTDPQDKGQHHALRIAAKRLRYTVEICRPAFAGRVDAFLEVIKHLQTLLGEIHDCDVWVGYLQAYLEREQKQIIQLFGHAGPLERLKVGIDYLRQNRQAHRERCFQELVEYWRELNAEGFWEALVEVVRAKPESPTLPAAAVPPDKKARPGPQPSAPQGVAPASPGGSNGKAKADRTAGLPDGGE